MIKITCKVLSADIEERTLVSKTGVPEKRNIANIVAIS